MKTYLPIICILILSSNALNAQSDSTKTRRLEAGISAGSLLPQFNGISATGEITYKTPFLNQSFKQTLGFDLLRYDFVRLNQIGYVGFAGKMGSLHYLIGYSMKFDNVEVDLNAGPMLGYGRIKPESEYAFKTKYIDGRVLGVKSKSNISYALSEKWKIGLDVSFLYFSLSRRSGDFETIKGNTLWTTQFGINYTILSKKDPNNAQNSNSSSYKDKNDYRSGKNKLKYSLGLGYGITTGAGVSFRYFPKRFGIQVNVGPFPKSLSSGLTFLCSLIEDRFTNFYLYQGNHLLSNFYNGYSFNFSTGIGAGCQFVIFKRFGIDIMAGYGLAFQEQFQYKGITGEVGLYYKF